MLADPGESPSIQCHSLPHSPFIRVMTECEGGWPQRGEKTLAWPAGCAVGRGLSGAPGPRCDWRDIAIHVGAEFSSRWLIRPDVADFRPKCVSDLLTLPGVRRSEALRTTLRASCGARPAREGAYWASTASSHGAGCHGRPAQSSRTAYSRQPRPRRPEQLVPRRWLLSTGWLRRPWRPSWPRPRS